jgi:hypothetical protein
MTHHYCRQAETSKEVRFLLRTAPTTNLFFFFFSERLVDLEFQCVDIGLIWSFDVLILEFFSERLVDLEFFQRNWQKKFVCALF